MRVYETFCREYTELSGMLFAFVWLAANWIKLSNGKEFVQEIKIVLEFTDRAYSLRRSLGCRSFWCQMAVRARNSKG